MFARFFSCCRQPAGRDAADPSTLLDADGSVDDDNDNSSSAAQNRGCNAGAFWIGAELAWGLPKSFVLSTYGIATQVTDYLGHSSDLPRIELSYTSLAIAVPLSFAFSLGEAICHYAESKKMTESTSEFDGPKPPPNVGQYILIASHLLSDVTANLGSLLAFAETAGLKDAAPGYRYATYIGLTIGAVAGNWQEVRNAYESFSELNAQAQQAQGFSRV